METAGPRCPFCGAAWTEAMLAQYDAMTDPDGCACCGSAGPVGHRHEARELPAEDLCCESCGRALFLAPASLQT